MKNVIITINYVNHTNSSAVQWTSSSAATDSLATVIKNRVLVLQSSGESKPEEPEAEDRGIEE